MITNSLLAAMTAPAAAPLMIELNGSSFCLRCAKVQSKAAKQRPHAANWPPRTGARSFTRVRAPSARREAPEGACLAPEMALNRDPPMRPMVKAPPQSSIMRQGLENERYNQKEDNDIIKTVNQ